VRVFLAFAFFAVQKCFFALKPHNIPNKEYGIMYGTFGFWKTPNLIISDPEVIKGPELEIYLQFWAKSS